MTHRYQYIAAATLSLLTFASVANKTLAQEVITVEQANALIAPFYQALTANDAEVGVLRRQR